VDIESAAVAGGYTSLSHRLNSRLADCDVDISIEYDDSDRVIREVWTGRINKTVEFLYDERGNRVAEIETEGNLTITTTYEYDSKNRISRISVRKTVRQ
jgi:YD repeat-containing protein